MSLNLMFLQMSVVHFAVRKTASYTEPIKSKVRSTISFVAFNIIIINFICN